MSVQDAIVWKNDFREQYKSSIKITELVKTIDQFSEHNT